MSHPSKRDTAVREEVVGVKKHQVHDGLTPRRDLQVIHPADLVHVVRKSLNPPRWVTSEVGNVLLVDRVDRRLAEGRPSDDVQTLVVALQWSLAVRVHGDARHAADTHDLNRCSPARHGVFHEPETLSELGEWHQPSPWICRAKKSIVVGRQSPALAEIALVGQPPAESSVFVDDGNVGSTALELLS